VEWPPRLPASPGDLTDELALEALIVEAALAYSKPIVRGGPVTDGVSSSGESVPSY